MHIDLHISKQLILATYSCIDVQGAQQLVVSRDGIETLPVIHEVLPGSWKHRGGASKSMQSPGPHGYTVVDFTSSNFFTGLLSMLRRKQQVSARLVFQVLLSKDQQWIILCISSLSGAVSGVDKHVCQLSTSTLVKGLEPRQLGQADSTIQYPVRIEQHGLTSGSASFTKLSRPVQRQQRQPPETDMLFGNQQPNQQGAHDIDPAQVGGRTPEEKAQLAAAGDLIKTSEVQTWSAPEGGIGLAVCGNPQVLSLLQEPVQLQQSQHEVCMAFKLGDNWAKQVVQLEFEARIQLLKMHTKRPEYARSFPTLRVKLGLVCTGPLFTL